MLSSLTVPDSVSMLDSPPIPSSTPLPRERGRPWAVYAKHLFDHRTQLILLASIQACALLSIVAFTDGDMAAECLYGALAIRIVQALDLPRALSSDLIRRETETRGR